MDKQIQSFIVSEKNLTLCTSFNNAPYCANCYYAFLHEDHLLIFKSDSTTQHISNALINDRVAGTIVPEIGKTGTVKGIQFTGRFVILTGKQLDKAKSSYYLKYPFALVMPGDLWGIELLSIKMTDNTLGFGKKIHWEKSISQNEAAVSKELH